MNDGRRAADEGFCVNPRRVPLFTVTMMGKKKIYSEFIYRISRGGGCKRHNGFYDDIIALYESFSKS